MKRTLLIVMTIAVLGGLGLYVQKKPSNSLASSTATGSSSQAISPNTSNSSSSPASSSPSGYKDGAYQGSATDTPYGTVQVAVVISGGKITGINFLQMPNDQGYSREVTAYAKPLLKQNTIQAQSSNIEFVSGATSTSDGYEQSLQAALNQAANA